jgi:hypothetical protein
MDEGPPGELLQKVCDTAIVGGRSDNVVDYDIDLRVRGREGTTACYYRMSAILANVGDGSGSVAVYDIDLRVRSMGYRGHGELLQAVCNGAPRW